MGAVVAPVTALRPNESFNRCLNEKKGRTKKGVILLIFSTFAPILLGFGR
jgi:hypothetical protein